MFLSFILLFQLLAFDKYLLSKKKRKQWKQRWLHIIGYIMQICKYTCRENDTNFFFIFVSYVNVCFIFPL